MNLIKKILLIIYFSFNIIINCSISYSPLLKRYTSISKKKNYFSFRLQNLTNDNKEKLREKRILYLENELKKIPIKKKGRKSKKNLIINEKKIKKPIILLNEKNNSINNAILDQEILFTLKNDFSFLKKTDFNKQKDFLLNEQNNLINDTIIDQKILFTLENDFAYFTSDDEEKKKKKEKEKILIADSFLNF